jgi:hypothetical protein
MTGFSGKIKLYYRLVPRQPTATTTTTTTTTTGLIEDEDSDYTVKKRKKKNHMDDLDDDSGEDGDEDDESVEEVSRPSYEETMNSLSCITSLAEIDIEKLELFAKENRYQDTSYTSGTGKKAKKKPVTRGPSVNKKKILKIVEAPLKYFYNCRKPLRAIDMIGKVKNGKTLCVECGMMTEYRNHNMTHLGPVCMTHQSPSISHNHPVWSSSSTTGGGTDPSDTTLQESVIHPSSLLSSGPTKRMCQCCHKYEAYILIPVRSETFCLQSLQCCSSCHYHLRKLLLKWIVIPLYLCVHVT